MTTPNYEPAIDLDELDDFDSSAFWSPTRRVSDSYLDGMWGGWGGGWDRVATKREKTDRDAVTAHKMVQSFLNSFARDGRYVVSFDPKMSTAGTDMEAKRVVMTPAPILDETIDAREAGRILTGLVIHEICHPRYGRKTYEAVNRAFPHSYVADQVSNMLDDIRIERRFVDDYPGYAGIFDPTLEYVTKNLVAKSGGYRPEDPLNTMRAAVRYPTAADWTGLEDERDWWQDWASRWSKEDSPRRHVQAVREALIHMAQSAPPKPQPGPSQTQGDEDGAKRDEEADDNGLDAGKSDSEDGDEKIDAEGIGGAGGAPDVGDMSDDEIGEAADAAETAARAAKVGALPVQELPDCVGSTAVERAAKANGVDDYAIRNERADAQKAVDEQEWYEWTDDGRKVQVLRSTKGLIHGRLAYRASRLFRSSDLAARYIRDALMRSRTGHTDVAHYKKRGRLDQRGLHRIASGDFRLFDRKTAQSPGKYRVWIMLDRSGSMDGEPSRAAAQVATAIADASRYVDSLHLEVWAWSDAFREDGGVYGVGAGVVRVWQTGQPTSEIMKSIDLQSGGTPDTTVMMWARNAIKREVRVGETPVILFCSDGWGASNLGDVVAAARRDGIVVASVAFGDLNEASQKQRFGEDGYVAWQGSIIQTARPLSRLIARLVSK